MKILFKDKKDFTKKLQKELSEHYFVGGRDTLTRDMLSCDVLSVKTSKVDNNVLKKMKNLKWIINRNYTYDNINLKHCEAKNVGVINLSYSKNPLVDWIEKSIKKGYYLPYYTVVNDSDVGELLNKKFKYVQHLNMKSSDEKIFNAINCTNTLIVSLPNTTANRCVINGDILQALPLGANIVNLGDGKAINNKDLLHVIKEGRVNHVTADSLDSHYRQELIDTGKVTYTKKKAWKTNLNMSSYIKIIKKHIKSIEEDNPMNIVLDREYRAVEVFWE